MILYLAALVRCPSLNRGYPDCLHLRSNQNDTKRPPAGVLTRSRQDRFETVRMAGMPRRVRRSAVSTPRDLSLGFGLFLLGLGHVAFRPALAFVARPAPHASLARTTGQFCIVQCQKLQPDTARDRRGIEQLDRTALAQG